MTTESVHLADEGRMIRPTTALLFMIAAIPLGTRALASGFGEGVIFLVPALVGFIWMSLSGRNWSCRVAWFACSLSTLLWLPTCWWWEMQFGKVVQHTVVDQTLAAMGWSGLRIAVAVSLLPWLALVALCSFVGRRVLRDFDGDSANRYSMRDYLVTIALLCMALGWISYSLHPFLVRRQESEAMFVARFCDSFVGTQTVLLSKPKITELPVRGLMLPGSLHFYRITANFEMNDERGWGAWDYVVDDTGRVTNFLYSEASGLRLLPQFDERRFFERLSGPVFLQNGHPQQSGPTASIQAVPKSVAPGDTVRLSVVATPGSCCELNVQPFAALAEPPGPLQPVPDSGCVTMSFKLASDFKDKSIDCAVLCRESPGFRPNVASQRIFVQSGLAEAFK